MNSIMNELKDLVLVFRLIFHNAYPIYLTFYIIFIENYFIFP